MKRGFEVWWMTWQVFSYLSGPTDGPVYAAWRRGDPENFEVDGHYPVRELWTRGRGLHSTTRRMLVLNKPPIWAVSLRARRCAASMFSLT